jgi:hypothetical protein
VWNVVSPSKAAEFTLSDSAGFSCDKVAKTIRRIIPANPIIIRVHFQHVFRPVRVVLKRRQRLYQPPAPLVNEQTGQNLRVRWELGSLGTITKSVSFERFSRGILYGSKNVKPLRIARTA